MHPLVRFRRLIVELRRRRVMEVVAIYAGLSFALLQSADLIVSSLGISPFVLTALTLLILFGFPIAVIVGWIYDIDISGRPRRTRPAEPWGPSDGDEVARRRLTHLGWPARIEAFAIGAVLIAGSWVLARHVSEDALTDVTPTNAYAAYLVSPIRTPNLDPSNLEVAHELTHRLTHQLRGWETIHVVPTFVLDGMVLELGLKGDEAPTLEQAFEMAEAQYTDPGPPDALVAPIAQNLLELREQTTSLEDLRSESRNLVAHWAFESGMLDFRAWKLEAAASHFRDAIREDTVFAAAHYYRALALYWQTRDNPQLLLGNGPAIVHCVEAAIELAQMRPVRPGLLARMEAFKAFWEGDFPAAKRAYQQILRLDPSDTESWLMLGSVAYHDSMLQEVEPGHFVPRSDLNLAREAFRTAFDLSPGWKISFGELSSIDALLLETATSLNCPAFERPDEPGRHQDEIREAADQIAFCPLIEDSIVWVAPDDVDDERQRRAMATAEAKASETRHLLEDWSRIHPEHSRAHDEFAAFLSVQRSKLGCGAAGTAVHEQTNDIRSALARSLSLRADTTAGDLVRLSVVSLAMDDVERSKALLQQALSIAPTDQALPDEAANVFLALGMPRRALDLLEPTWSTLSFAIDDPEGGGFLALGDIARPITELQMYGATGLVPEIERAFDALLAEWAALELSPIQAVHVRRAMLMWVGPALALLPDARARWFDGWNAAGVAVPPVWHGFLALDAEATTETKSGDVEASLEQALSELERAEETGPTSYYVTAILAQAAGRHAEAIEQFLIVESCPLNLQRHSPSWGLRTRSRWHRAQSYFALGDSIRARAVLASHAVYQPDPALN